MLIQKAKFKEVKRVVTERISDEVHGCDTCRKEIDFNKREVEYLEISVFNHSDENSSRQIFCSWRCVAKGVRKVKSDYFVSLPYLHYDTKTKGMRAKDFIALLKP